MFPLKRSPSTTTPSCSCGGAEQPRNLPIPGRELKGIHFAMEFLPQQNRRCEGDAEDQFLPSSQAISAGQARRHHRRRRHRRGLPRHQPSPGRQERSPVRDHAQAARERAASTPWPLWPLQLRTEGAHEEGGIRDWSINSIKFTGDEHGNVKQLHLVRVGPPPKFEPIPAPSSRSTSIWSCWPWASSARCATA
jgi:glutamate synthase (NADPH/NADH) small chain